MNTHNMAGSQFELSGSAAVIIMIHVLVNSHALMITLRIAQSVGKWSCGCVRVNAGFGLGIITLGDKPNLTNEQSLGVWH